MPIVEHDVIVVGAGSAGCALATRLAEQGRDVLLVEAGPYFASVRELPDELRWAGTMEASRPGGAYNWSFHGRITDSVSGPIARGRVVGGSSAINGAYFLRGAAADFDRWAAAGNPEWAYDKVLPCLVRMETDLDFGDQPYHGASGPVPIRRAPAGELTAASTAFLASAESYGFEIDADMNHPSALGAGAYPMNCVDGVRVNAALAYFARAAWSRLTISAETVATRITFEGQRATGVEAVRNGERVRFGASEVVLSCGAIKSPHLLMLSGLGPATLLRQHDIPVVCDLAGVGKDFTDHPAVIAFYTLDVQPPAAETTPVVQVGLNYTSERKPLPGNMELLVGASPSEIVPGSTGRAGAGSEFTVSCQLNQSESRGSIGLNSADPFDMPTIAYHYMTDEIDIANAREALRLVADLIRQPAYCDLGAQMRVLSELALADDAALDRHILANVTTAIHMSSSCRMGPDGDPTAVVDQTCRVRGVEGLRVADTSIMPSIVTRGTSATAVMIGERASDFFA